MLHAIGTHGHRAGGAKKDRVEKEEIACYKEIVTAIPFVREEHISALRVAIREASYCIDDYQVATKMVDRSLVDTLCVSG